MTKANLARALTLRIVLIGGFAEQLRSIVPGDAELHIEAGLDSRDPARGRSSVEETCVPQTLSALSATRESRGQRSTTSGRLGATLAHIGKGVTL